MTKHKAIMKEIPVRLLKWLRPIVLHVLYVWKKTNPVTVSLFLSLSSYTVNCIFPCVSWKCYRCEINHMWFENTSTSSPLPNPSEIIQTCFTNHWHLILRLPRCRSLLCGIKIHYLQQFFLRIGNRRRLWWLILFWYSHLTTQGYSFWKQLLMSFNAWSFNAWWPNK